MCSHETINALCILSACTLSIDDIFNYCDSFMAITKNYKNNYGELGLRGRDSIEMLDFVLALNLSLKTVL